MMGVVLQRKYITTARKTSLGTGWFPPGFDQPVLIKNLDITGALFQNVFIIM